jgi:hypothetical protein
MKALIRQPDKRKKTAGSFRFLLLQHNHFVGTRLPAIAVYQAMMF